VSAQASALSRAPGVLIAINQLLKRMSDSLSPLQSEDLLLCAKHLFVAAMRRAAINDAGGGRYPRVRVPARWRQ
jgi:hypothetical protein